MFPTQSALQYKIKAQTTSGFTRTVRTNDCAFGVAWIKVMAEALKAEAQPDDEIIISMFDTTIKPGSNLVYQFQRIKGEESHKSFVSNTLMLQEVARKEIYYE